MENSIDPDQTAQEQSDLGLHYLPDNGGHSISKSKQKVSYEKRQTSALFACAKHHCSDQSTCCWGLRGSVNSVSHPINNNKVIWRPDLG